MWIISLIKSEILITMGMGGQSVLTNGKLSIDIGY